MPLPKAPPPLDICPLPSLHTPRCLPAVCLHVLATRRLTGVLSLVANLP
jgi:hypothetical protein